MLLFRCVAIGAWTLTALLFLPSGRRPDLEAALPMLATYLGVSASLWFAGTRSERVLELSWIATALVDVLSILIVQYRAIPASPTPPAEAGLSVAVLAVAVIIAMFSMRRSMIGWTALASLAAAIVLLRRGNVDPSHWASALLLLVLIGVAGSAYVRQARQLITAVSAEELQRERLGRYFSPAVRDQIAARGAAAAAGESREVTVFFTDLRDFTSTTEQLDGPGIVALLNEYHSEMVAVVFRHGGTLDKFIGDGMMGYFNAPLPREDHALAAVNCALDMLDALALLKTRRSARLERALNGARARAIFLADDESPRRRATVRRSPGQR